MGFEVQERIEKLSIEERKKLFDKVELLLSQKQSESNSRAKAHLVAYVTAKKDFDSKALKRSLKSKVPEYMIPSKIIKVDQFPVLPNGKVDKKALSRIHDRANSGMVLNELQAPTNDIEREIHKIWQDVLGLKAIGVHENFFEIGGESILSIQVIAKARSLKIPLSPNELFENQTIAELASLIAVKRKKAMVEKSAIGFEYLVHIKPAGSKPPVFCLHSAGSHFFFYNLFAKHLSADRPVYALQASKHEGKIKLHNSVEEMAIAFISEIKRVYPTGPYHFVSYCFNTAIGLEITKRLGESNDSANLIIADTVADYHSLFSLSKTKIRALSIMTSIRRQPIKTIRRVFEQRIVLPLKKKYEELLFDNSKKKIKKLHDNHVKIYNSYSWSPFNGSVQLMLTKKNNSDFNAKILDSWKKIALNGVKVTNVEGHHNNLFLEKSVKSTAANMEKCMTKYESELQ